MHVPRSRLAIGLVSALLVLAACSPDDVAGSTSTTSTVAPSTTSSQPPTSTTEADVGLDLAEWWWVSNGPGGIRLGGYHYWATQPFPAAIARDRQGGFVFTDSTGLWWFRANHLEPSKVADVAAEWVSVVTTEDGPVAMVWDGGTRFIRLSDGAPVDAPRDVSVDLSTEFGLMTTWTADNGLSAWVTMPLTVLDGEGQPSEILEPSRLVVARGDEVLLDVEVGVDRDAWARLHDFNGRNVIVSYGPYEPAMAEETFLLIDLATGEVTEMFVAGGTGAALTGADVDWNGPVAAPEFEF